MAPAKAVRTLELAAQIEPAVETAAHRPAALSGHVPQRLPNALAGSDIAKAIAVPIVAIPNARPRRDTGANFQARIPVVIGEATFRGSVPVDGIISGQLGPSGSTLQIKQRPRGGPLDSGPELTGEISFKDMLRINGHISGTVFSQKGTLIVDASALVDGDINVGVLMISGTVNGDVTGHERVELGPAAVINGNISTRALTMKPGAVFQGDCRMLKSENGDQ